MMIELHRASLDQAPSGRLEKTDITVIPGERIVLTGPRGGGKRALLSLLTGAAPPSEGTARYTSEDAELSPRERKRRIRVIPAGGGLWEDLTVWENLLAACRLYGMSRKASEISAERAMEECGLTRAEDIRFGKLPPDWRIRAALAAARASGAEVIGAADAAAGLFKNESLNLASLMGRLFDDRTTVIACEEDPALAEAFGKRFLMLREGRLVFDGTAKELLLASHRGDFASAAAAFFREAEG